MWQLEWYHSNAFMSKYWLPCLFVCLFVYQKMHNYKISEANHLRVSFAKTRTWSSRCIQWWLCQPVSRPVDIPKLYFPSSFCLHTLLCTCTVSIRTYWSYLFWNYYLYYSPGGVLVSGSCHPTTRLGRCPKNDSIVQWTSKITVGRILPFHWYSNLSLPCDLIFPPGWFVGKLRFKKCLWSFAHVVCRDHVNRAQTSLTREMNRRANPSPHLKRDKYMGGLTTIHLSLFKYVRFVVPFVVFVAYSSETCLWFLMFVHLV